MTDKQLRTCASCFATGKHGANCKLIVDGKAVDGVYHRYCGEEIARAAPEGHAAEVVTLAQWHRREREAEAAKKAARLKSFWEEKISQGRRKNSGNGHAPPPAAQPSG